MSKSDPPDGKNSSGIQVITRAASILRALENEEDGLSLGQIAEKVDLPRSTVQRIVNALTQEHFLIGASFNTGVKLGPAILRMASNTNFDFVRHVHPFLEVLAQRTGETVDLSLHQGKKMVFVDQIATNQRLSVISEVGESFPMYSSANGKAALSLLTDKEIEKAFKMSLIKETDNTITKISTLLAEIKNIRKTDIAIDDEEHTNGICAVGTAFRDPLDRIFAVSVPVPSIRFHKSRKSITDALLIFREELMTSITT